MSVQSFTNEALQTGRFGQHTEIVLKTVLIFFSVKYSMTHSACPRLSIQPAFLPHKGKEYLTLALLPTAEAGVQLTEVQFSYARASATCEKQSGRSQLHLGHPVPCPLRPDWNSRHPVQINAHRITAA